MKWKCKRRSYCGPLLLTYATEQEDMERRTLSRYATGMSLMGKSAWYMPKWFDRILPNIDVEGESIMHEMEKTKKKSA